jgi:D-alanyl-lipoteichoic acid acyltransferase DltB (MBOAT superfamily)
MLDVVLPIGISFFTFTQIAYLIDSYSGIARERNPVHYALFVSFFPHLIAGPVLHHAQMMPQFARPEPYRLDYERLASGILIFVAGLAKKLVIADPLGVYADVLFDAGPGAQHPALFLAWSGTLAYAFQLYFDFSGYSDMAVGLSLLFGIRLPFNFNAPYRATSIIDFWLRWHMTLTRFLTAYIFDPLALRLTRRRLAKGLPALTGRNPSVTAFVSILAGPILLTMFLAGLWHGAGWLFILFGSLHGVYLVINHAWRRFVVPQIKDRDRYRGGMRPVGWCLTFLSVCLAFVLFRAHNLVSAWEVYRGIFGLNGISLPAGLAESMQRFAGILPIAPNGIWQDRAGNLVHFVTLVAMAFALCLLPRPFAQSVLDDSCSPRFFTKFAGVLCAGIFAYCVLRMGESTPFLYFQF